ncbi:hypothetical protein TNCV_730691 [Trichonephila clavipes]|nr:hypothetical protein TNCV_730691 [Trichonephila clavipes]
MELRILSFDKVARTTSVLAPPSPNFHFTPTGGQGASTDLTCITLLYTAGIQWSMNSNLRHSVSEFVTITTWLAAAFVL